MIARLCWSCASGFARLGGVRLLVLELVLERVRVLALVGLARVRLWALLGLTWVRLIVDPCVCATRGFGGSVRRAMRAMRARSSRIGM